MMRNKYIINKGFSVKYDLESLLLCFDYFNHGLVLPKYVDSILTRKILHQIARITIKILYYFKLYQLIYKTSIYEEDAVVILKGKGRWANTVKLIRDGKKLKIIKETFNKEAYQREKRFYFKYKNNRTKIKLPETSFLDHNIIEMEFIKAKSFQRLINDGSLDLKKSIDHFTTIKRELNYFYKKDNTLIHNDLSPENIFIHENKYYLIDFSDCQFSNSYYDLFILLRSILFSFHHIKVNKTPNLSFDRKTVAGILNLKIEKIKIFEDKFKNLDIKKHPNHITLHNKKQFPGVYYN